MNEKLVTRKQVATYYGVTPETVRNWERKGLICSFCIINRHPRYSLEEVTKSLSGRKNIVEGIEKCS